MFEITGDDIAALSDEDLRNLVALLCEAELRSRGLSTSAVTAGGNQDAADGGVDVRVDLPAVTKIDGFVPRASTVFQVKVPDMPRSAILAEMKPSGTLRPAITELTDLSGAYVIVSSTGSTSDSALQDRHEAMAEAVASLPNAGSLALDFYDRTRIASWARNHPGLIPWVRQRIGKSIEGWQSYGPWAYPAEGLAGEYLVDENLRVRTGEEKEGDGIAALAGVERIRDLLREPGKIVRLVGLSGVGKTRLVQGLFDERIGKGALNPALAIYTNLADGPDPQPVGLASDLIASKSRAVLVIDNCPPDLHRRLSDLCRAEGSGVSVITIEYDIRDDQQEGTEVFKLEPSSEELIEKLIRKRFPDVSQVDAGTIAKFSGGNARVAMALAATVGKNETITGLKDEDLFRRLFQQGHQHSDDLLRIAQACALVYSFQGEEIAGADAELPRLGALVGKSAEEVFAGVAELYRRDLAQKRNVWRAVLPHAIANRLAALALQNIPTATIEAQLVRGAPERLTKSFSRRLGYVNASKEAAALVESWLGANGLLGKPAELNDFHATMFRNVAPVAPEVVVAALERACAAGDEAALKCKPFARLLRSIAYDAKLFERCAIVLAKLAEAEKNDNDTDDASNVLVSLFPIHLSGTHASIEQRLKVVEALVRSPDKEKQAFGLAALRKVLETGPFSSSYDFDFGARSRDHGYAPRFHKEVVHWFGSALTLAVTLASFEPVASDVKALLASSFRGIWNAGMGDELDRFFRKIAGKQPWREGWIAVRQTQRYDAKKMNPDVAMQLAELEKALRPKDLLDKVRAIVLSGKPGRLDLDEWEEDEDIAKGLQRRADLVRELGQQTAKDEEVLAKLLPDLVTGRGELFYFGEGLARGADAANELWQSLGAEMGKVERPNEQVLRGFLSGLRERDAAAVEALLEAALADKVLAPLFPILQASVPIDKEGVRRIKQSLTTGVAPPENFQILAWGRSSDPILPADLRDMLLSIGTTEAGLPIACDMLYMRLHADREKQNDPAPELIEAGRELLSRLKFKDKNDREDHRLGDLAKACLKGKEGFETARALGERLRIALSKHETHASYYDDFLRGLFAVQPIAALHGLLGGSAAEQKQGLAVIRDMRHLRSNPLDAAPDEQLMDWCDRDPEVRYTLAASFISFAKRGNEDSPATQWSPTVLKLLEKAPDRVAFLKPLIRQFRPMSWSGSRAALLEANAKLLDPLESHPDAAVADFVRAEKLRLAEEVASERLYETERDRTTDERFE